MRKPNLLTERLEASERKQVSLLQPDHKHLLSGDQKANPKP